MVFVIVITFNLIQQCVLASSCIYYNQYDSPNYVGIKSKQHSLNLQNDMAIGIGFWISYRPLEITNLPQNPNGSPDPDLKQLFVFSFKPAASEKYSLVFYVEFSIKENAIRHNMMIQSDNEIQTIIQQMDVDTYEGSWIFTYLYLDQMAQSININYKYLNQDLLKQQVFFGQLLLDSEMESTTGGYQVIKLDDSQTLYLQAYPGLIQPVIFQLKDYFLDNIQEFLQNCQPFNQCQHQITRLVSYNTQIVNSRIIVSQQISSKSYLFKGWIKQDYIVNQLKSEAVLLRISLNQKNSDDSKIENKLFLIKYYQNIVQFQQNGFSLQTYSYIFPWVPNNYIADEKDTIYILGEVYLNLLTQWHYIQCEIGTSTNNGQPIYTVYYAANDKIEQHTWTKQINHFSVPQLYFYIGEDDYGLFPFKGYLSDWVFNQLCDTQTINFQPKCHYKCLTCRGITAQDCTSCDKENLRVYSAFQNACICQFGYVDQPEIAKCQELNNYLGIFQISEQEIKLSNKKGYYLIDEKNIICEFGYFKYNNKCIECPYPVKDNIIQCGDCILYPDDFSQTLTCTFQLKSQDESQVLMYNLLGGDEIEYYQISDITIDNEYQVFQLIGSGIQEMHQCKFGYFYSNNKCLQCSDQCQKCENEVLCATCMQGYKLNTNYYCEKCLSCVIETVVEYQGMIIKARYCQPGMFQTLSRTCAVCGDYCQLCSSQTGQGQCYYCLDNSKYFITLDAFNCAQCPIENCKYCFQYYINSDQVIVNTLDLGVLDAKINPESIITACALCEQNYFYSFVTQKCEEQPNDMTDCYFGVKYDLQSNKCIISDTRTDAIQQSNCIDPYCQYCINNYSQLVESFCIQCLSGFYSSFNTGQCIKCPSSCLTCTEYSLQYNNNWKWDIRAFYQAFININNDHNFENNQPTILNVVCQSCYPNYQLLNNICQPTCSNNCEKCDTLKETTPNFVSTYSFQCNKCSPDTFNTQRSVEVNQKSQCLTCPEYCSACIPRSADKIQALNPFFNQSSSYSKYSNICYKTDSNSGVKITPLYQFPNKCQNYTQCQKIITLSIFVYCDFQHFISAMNDEPDQTIIDKYQFFYNLLQYSFLDQFQTEEMFEYMNQLQITELTYHLQLIYYSDQFSYCYIIEGANNITNIWKQYVFTLQNTNLWIVKGQQSQQGKLPLFIQTPSFSIINFNKIIFEEIQIVTDQQSELFTESFYANISIMNDYDPITLIFKNCDIIQTIWERATVLSISGNKQEKLIIESMTLQDLLIENSLIFNLQPLKEFSDSLQQISYFIIKNSSFTNTSIFTYNAEQYSLNQIMNFTNVTILNTNFSNSSFIDSSIQFGFNIGELYLENFHLENLTVQVNSILFDIQSVKLLNVKNLTLINVKFLDKSSLIVSNIINIEGLSIINSIINQGYFISIEQQSLFSSSTLIVNTLRFSKISFINNTYSSQNSFIQILSNDLTKNNFTCSELFLDNNVLTNSIIGKQIFSQNSYSQSLIYIDCVFCSLINLKIYRGIGLPEISIINSQQLQISNLHIETNQQYFKRYLHSSVECLKKFIYLDHTFVLFIMAYEKIEIENIFVQNTIIVNSQLIHFVGLNEIEQIQSENIVINNSVFKNNILLNINLNQQSSLISIETQQISVINIINVEFSNNLLNQHNSNDLKRSSTTILIDAKLGDVNLKQSQFNQNSITNSSDSIMYIYANSVIISYCNFTNQNILSDEIIQKNIISLIDTYTYASDIQNQFQILSEGGNGYIQANEVKLKNIQVQNSFANNGGGFYITTNGMGIILLENCSFQNTSTVLNSMQLASGGCLYIDSSKSFLNLILLNCKIESAYSRTQGGAIYIQASKSINSIQFHNLLIKSVFSMQHQFLSFTPSKLISIKSEIIITNSSFQNTQRDFERYVSQIQDLQEQNIILFQTDNPLIYVQFSNFTIKNCQFDNIHLAFLIEVEQGQEINLQHIIIQNSSIFQSPIMRLGLRTDTKGTMLLNYIFVSNLIEYPLSYNEICYSLNTLQNELLCPNAFSNVDINPKIISSSFNFENQLNCNLNQLYSIISESAFSLIEVSKLQENHFVIVENLDISQIQCSKCQYGVFSIKSFDFGSRVYMENIKIMNNNCGVLGCLSMIQSVDNIDLTQFSELPYNLSTNEIESKNFDITLKNSKFINNNASYGGACFFSETNIFINNSFFQNNQAKILGGAIYYNSNKSNLLLLNSQIIKNSANIGGGIYLKQQQLQKIEQINLFIQENNGQLTQNLYEIPRFLHLSLNNINQENGLLLKNSSIIVEQVKIIPYTTFFSKLPTDVLFVPSGIKFSEYTYFNPQTNSYIPYKLTFRLQVQNQFKEKIWNLQNTKCDLSAKIHDKSNPNLLEDQNISGINQTQFISASTIFFSMETGDYNLDDFIVYFNPYQNENYQLQLAFFCDSISISYNFNQLEETTPNIIPNYLLILNLRTFECQIGEFFNQTSGGCVLCDITQSQYSVTLNASFCSFKDETKIDELQSGSISLKPHYWRAYYYSDILEECHNLLANCEGGWLAGNPSCAIGHIGALCEQCDLYNIKGEGSYSSNQSYSCSNCDLSTQNLLNIILVIIWTIISVLITVNSTIKMIDEFVYQLKLKPLGFFSITEAASTSVLLKVFTNYLQIVSSIASFQLLIPISLTLAVRGLGNPSGSIAFSFNCYLKSITSIQMLYFQIIWGFTIAGIYIFLLCFFHILIACLKKRKLNITFVTTTLIYVYIYLSPNLVSDLSLLISYRNISGQKWIASNVAYLYNTQQHKNWLIYFVTPTFLVIGIFLPIFFWYIIYHHRASLNTSKTRKVFGYLYNEYKVSAYYWETIKIIQKELIILILIYYEDYVTIKACLIFFLLHLYSKLTTKFKPYLTENLNQIDSLSTSICQISILLAQSIYSAQNLNIQEVVWSFYLVLAFLNCYFIIEMSQKLIFAYFDKLYVHIDKVKIFMYNRLPPHVKKNIVCLRLLQNTTERKQIIRLRFQKVKQHLIRQAKYIIAFKNQNDQVSQFSTTRQYSSIYPQKILTNYFGAMSNNKFFETDR